MWNENELSREERALLKTVVSIVGTTSVDRTIRLTDNFFEIGGNSLNAVNVVTKLRDQGFHLGQKSRIRCRKPFRWLIQNSIPLSRLDSIPGSQQFGRRLATITVNQPDTKTARIFDRSRG